MDIQTKEDDQLSPTKRDGSIEPPFESSSPPSDNNDEGIHEPEDFRELNLPVPFSALTQTMRPNIRPHRHTSQSSSSSTEDAEQNSLLEESADGKVGHEQAFRNVSRPSCITDEFGFKVDLTKCNLPTTPFLDSVDHRRDWLVCLEFSYTNRLGVPEELGELDNGIISQEESLWSRIVPQITPSARLTELIRGIPDPRVKAPVWVGMARSNGEEPSAVSASQGIPHCFRSKIWPRLSGAYKKQEQAANQQPPLTYADLVHCTNSLSAHVVNQIEKDLLRTMPNNACFCSATSVGVPRLKRVLLAVAWLYTDVGYCQGLGVIAANLLLFMEEEAAFWMMCSIIEDILPPSYFSADSLMGVQADQRVLGELISVFMPRLEGIIQEHEVDLALITLGWFLTLYSGVLSMRIMLRVWDLLFYEGSTVLFRVALAILKLNEEVLLETKNTASFFNAVSAAPASITDVAELCKVAYSFEDEYLDQTYIDGLRRHHLSQLLVEISSTQCLAPVKPLPKQFLSKRNMKSKPGFFCGFFGDSHASEPQNELFSVLDSTSSSGFSSGLQEVIGSALCLSGAARLVGYRTIDYYSQFKDIESTDPKIKNIRQTELLVNLRQAILAIVRHFHSNDPSHSKISAQPDYSLASHGRDLAEYVQTAAVQTRRAKALEDFARQENDELGFLRNDIITVLDMHDEHCWLGELNGLRGWFPAKLVELLDERSKRYTPAGDDTVYPNIGHLVRQGLCSALRAIFEYGLKRTRGLTDTSSTHPWKFIEEVAAAEAARDSSSIHSRLILCRTFRLDEVGKVLSPEELLYRSIHSINASHNAPGVTDDVKFHTLICIGLNELVLHLWLEILCSCEEVVTKRYHPWSFLRSPGWVQIKCELRVLSQFAFHLYPLWEIDAQLDSSSKVLATYEHKSFHKAKLPLRLLSKLHLGVRPLDPSDDCDFGAFKRDTESTGDMLVKYHLFSWEL